MRSPITAISKTTRAIIDDAFVIGESRDRTVDRLEQALSRRELAEDLYDHDLQRRQRQSEDGTQDVPCQQLAIEAPSWYDKTGIPQTITTSTGQTIATQDASWHEFHRARKNRRVKSKAVDRANELGCEDDERTDRIVRESGMDRHDNLVVVMRKVRQIELFGG